MRKNSSTERMVRHGNWLPMRVVESPFQMMFKEQLDVVLSALV